MNQFINLNNIKLIIWDLDETLWSGTLEEKNFIFRIDILDFIQKSVDRGIMHSICSKNDFEKVRTTFFECGFEKYWNYFLFPSINFEGKGKRVQNIISNMQLREENVLFIDDNEINLNEVNFFSPNINILLSENLKDLIKNLYFVNSFDINCSRLNEYKILEKKVRIKEIEKCSNEEFLRNSNIRVSIVNAAKENLARIFELIKRTNQLNFTKARIEKDELIKLLESKEYENKIIEIEDDYGYYGICGFYSFNKKLNKLEHFLFSCRIMGMGVEQYIYQKLKFPNLTIIKPIRTSLKKEICVDWIEETKVLIKNTDLCKADTQILFKGPCDLLSTIDFLKLNCKIDTEFPYYNENYQYILEHTHLAYIVQSKKLSKEKLVQISHTFPYPPVENFSTKFFDNKYDVIFLSLLTTSFSGLYLNKNDGTTRIFGFANVDITDENNWEKTLEKIPENLREANLTELKKFKEEYTFAGEVPLKHVKSDLEFLLSNLAPKTKLVLVLGSEKECKQVLRGYENMHIRHKILNDFIIKNFSKNPQVKIINLTNLIESENDYTTCIDHFERIVYIKLALCLEDILLTNK